MKFKVYYGIGEDITKLKEIAEFCDLQEAENFVIKYINTNHNKVYYIQTTYISETYRRYDYESYIKFYSIIGCKE